MPTIRSQFNFAQFETVLQKLAHETAVEAVTGLKQGDVRVVIHGSRFTDVETSKRQFRFYSNHASYCEYPAKKYAESSWCFDVEEKLYLTSNHCTKISFYAGEDREETEKKILAFINKIMADSSIKPVPRFTLDKCTGNQQYLDLMKKK